MKEEGFLNKAFNLIKKNEVEARWLMNQGGFNFPEDTPVSITQKVCVAFSIAVITKASDQSSGPDEALMKEALDALTIGELKVIMSKVSK